MEGLMCLSRVTHLTLWVPTHDNPRLPPPAQESPVPGWIQDIPLSSFRSLTHLAFTLCSNHISTRHKANPSVFRVPPEVLLYIAPSPSADFTPSVFREWALGDAPLDHGVVVPFRALLVGNRDLGWEFSFMWGESDEAWAEADRLTVRGNAGCTMDWE
ncbi:hypothetical protein B0H17DRAFT_1134266 [Mycena rosella]|uniref:Uncharacterized protein n=1 Tax=Mycena rosella TaxID=1033263 RepID=A0AAD7DGM6_MYCRO|nr:hypothetical protein B0H17DRAFT_1134266 [Mycena rosella]